MRRILLATIASMALAGTALAQGGQAGATGAGVSPGTPTGNTPSMGTTSTTGGAVGTGHDPSDKSGAGANLPNAVGNQAPSGSSNAPTSR